MKKFTMIELLVVIAVIGVLTSILLPSLNRAKEMTKRAVCRNNTYNLYVGALASSKNNNGELPNGDNAVLENFIWVKHGDIKNVFIEEMIPYWGGQKSPKTWPSILLCPSNSNERELTSDGVSNSLHYIYTGNFFEGKKYIMREGLKKRLKFIEHDKPSEVTVFADTTRLRDDQTKINHSVDLANIHTSTIISPYVAGGNRNTLDGATKWQYPSTMGFIKATQKEAAINEANFRAKAGTFTYWW